VYAGQLSWWLWQKTEAHHQRTGVTRKTQLLAHYGHHLIDMTLLCLDLVDLLHPGPGGPITNPASIDFSGLQMSLDKLASTSWSTKPGFDHLSPQRGTCLSFSAPPTRSHLQSTSLTTHENCRARETMPKQPSGCKHTSCRLTALTPISRDWW
jgi:hypothetical protein